MLAIAVDLGASKMRACLADDRGRIIRKSSMAVVTDGGAEGLVERLIGLVRSLLDERHSIEKVKAIGVGSIGPLNLSKGTIVRSPNIPYGTVHVTKPLGDAFKRPVTLLNDATAAVLGERFFGAGKQHPNLVYVTLSTGIGAGVMVDGHLLLGKDGNAAEAGHMTIDCSARLVCGCGKRGHWEAYCSGRNIPNFARLIVGDLAPYESRAFSGSPVLVAGAALETRLICEAANVGDPLARMIMEKVGKMNAIGLANLVNLFDPSLVTIGGSVALRNRDLTMHPILGNIEHHLINRPPHITITPLGDDVGLMGALAAALGLFRPSSLGR